MKKNLYLSSLALLLFVLAGCFQIAEPSSEAISRVLIKDADIKVTLALTPEEQTKGLGGVESLSDSEGMLFLFPEKETRTFWMKGMKIPIDIIWISGNSIVGVAQNVPPPRLGSIDSELPLYTSQGPVEHVLEVAAGFFERHSLAVGDTVQYR